MGLVLQTRVEPSWLKKLKDPEMTTQDLNLPTSQQLDFDNGAGDRLRDLDAKFGSSDEHSEDSDDSH